MPDTYDPFSWGATATSLGLSHAPSRPNDTDIGDGYQSEEPIPAAEFNWLAAFIGRMSVTTHVYTDAATAMDTMSVGDLSFIDEYDGNQFPGSMVSAADGPTVGGAILSCDTTGYRTVYLESGGVARMVKGRWTDANFTGTDRIVTYTLSSFTATARVIRTNGEYTVVAYDNHMEIFNAETGASIADINHGAAVNDVCLDGVNAYLVGAVGTGSKTVRCIALATGTSVWTYAHSTELFSCCTDGRRLFVAGTAHGSGSAATHRALEAATGNDAANEGGTAASTWPDIWDAALSNTVSVGQCLVTDGRSLWAGYDSGSSNQVEQIGTAAGVVQASFDISGDTVGALAVDHECVFAITGTILVCFDKNKFPNVRWTAVDDFNTVTSDGFMVTVGGAAGATGGALQRRYRRNRPCQIRKVTPADQYNPYRLAFIAAGE